MNSPIGGVDGGRLRLAFFAVVLLALVLRVAFFAGYQSGDDRAYIARAVTYSQGDIAPPYSHWGARSALVIPVAAGYSALGVSDLTTVAMPFAFSLLGVLVAWMLGRHLFDESVGVMAAFLLAVFPMDVLFASQLFPYAYLSTLGAASLLLFLSGAERSSTWRVVAAGVCLGLAYLSRITALYALLFFALHALWERRLDAKYWLFAAGLSACFVAEAIWGLVQSGDPLQRLSILMSKVGGKVPAPSGPATERGIQWFLEPFTRPFVEQEFGLFFLFMAGAVVFALVRARPRAVTLLLLWIIPIFLYVNYGTTNPTDYSTLRRLPRYLSMTIVPWMVLVAWVLTQCSGARLRYSALGLLALTSVGAVALDNSRFVASQSRDLVAFLDREVRAGERLIVPRSRFFDYLYLRGFLPAEGVEMFAYPKDRSDTLKRIRIVWPDVPTLGRTEDICDGVLVVDQRFFRDDILELASDGVDMGEIPAPQRLYYRLLENELVLKVLSLVRDPKRLRMLTDRSDRTLRVVRIERPCRGGGAS